MILNHRCAALETMVVLGVGHITRGARQSTCTSGEHAFICTSQSWFGGGGDLTPLLPNAEVERRFMMG